MPKRHNWTVTQLEDAVQASKTIKEVMHLLGIKKPSSRFREALSQLDTSHFRKGKYDWSEPTLRELVARSQSITEVLQGLGLKGRDVCSGGNYRIFNAKIQEYKLDTQHFLGQHWARGKKLGPSNRKLPLQEVLVAGKYRSGGSLKKRLLAEGVFQYKCSECDIATWREKKLTLQLDHISGDPGDNRLENLRLLCPNCHSQTETFSKGIRKTNPVPTCGGCSKLVSRRNTQCLSCAQKSRAPCTRPKKIEWPNIEVLTKMVWDTPVSTLASQLGVSDKAIAKHCKKLQITIPGRGYWAKLRAKRPLVENRIRTTSFVEMYLDHQDEGIGVTGKS